MVLQPLYKDAPEKVMKHFDQLAEKAADDMDDSEKTYFYMFLGDVAKREPKVFSFNSVCSICGNITLMETLEH